MPAILRSRQAAGVAVLLCGWCAGCVGPSPAVVQPLEMAVHSGDSNANGVFDQATKILEELGGRIIAADASSRVASVVFDFNEEKGSKWAYVTIHVVPSPNASDIYVHMRSANGVLLYNPGAIARIETALKERLRK